MTGRSVLVACLVAGLIAAAFAFARDPAPEATDVPNPPTQTTSPSGDDSEDRRYEGSTPVVPQLTAEDVGSLPPGPVDDVLIVDVDHPSASADSTGSSEDPFSSIQAAVERASDLRAEGRGVEIVVEAGVYRESVAIGPGGVAETPLVISGVGEPSISGADIWDQWKEQSDGTWAHPWPYDWGSDSEVGGIAGRREIVAIDGQRLEQVATLGLLRAGTFTVDEESELIYVRPLEGVDLREASVEVAVRPSLLVLDGAAGVTIRGFRMEYAAAPFDGTAVTIVNSADVRIIDNRISDTSWTGIGVGTSAGLSFIGNVIVDNGGGGMTIYLSPSLLMSDNDTSSNNWRGARGGYLGWSIGGVKMVGQHDTVVQNHRSVGNATKGFWLDYDVRDVVIVDSVFTDNETDGLMIEAVLGPVDVIGIEASRNGGNGVLVVDSIDVTIAESEILGNGAAAIRFDSEPDGRVLEIEPDPIELPALENLVLVENIIGESNQLIKANLSPDKWQRALDTLVSNDNHWLPINPEFAFDIAGVVGDFDMWRDTTGQDSESTFGGA